METTAELRHREVLAKAEAHAEAVHVARTGEFVEALRVRDESQRVQDAMMPKNIKSTEWESSTERISNMRHMNTSGSKKLR